MHTIPPRWTSTLLGLLGLEDESLFPRARPALLEGDAEGEGDGEGGSSEGGEGAGGGSSQGGEAASAALLFLPGDRHYKQVLDEIRHPKPKPKPNPKPNPNPNPKPNPKPNQAGPRRDPSP